MKNPLFQEKKIIDGEPVTYYLSQGTGLHWSMLHSRYKSQFGELPQWVINCHPVQRIELIKAAMDTGLPLPEFLPDKAPRISSPSLRAYKERVRGYRA